jgi:group I intron endonuclease
MMFYCYKITNTVNDKVYIGITNNPDRRWADHTKYKCKHAGSDRPLYRAINKYSSDNFKMDILTEKNTWDEVCKDEVHYIKEYDSFHTSRKGYNLTLGGQGCRGLKMSKSTKKKLSKINKTLRQDKYLHEYYRKNPEMRSIQQKKVMADPKIRKNLSDAATKQMSNPENRELSRQGALKQWQNPEYVKSRTGSNHPMARAVMFYGKKYGSITEVAREYGKSTGFPVCRMKKYPTECYYL